jgi:UDP-N-acetylglucosamine:LPS N-acetylglucosamine transferase
MYQLRPWWRKYDRFWVTFPGVDTTSLLSRERIYYGYQPDTRNLVNAVRHLFLAWKVLRRERPSILISCGAGIAPPFFYVAKLLGIKTVYIEVYDFLSKPSLSARLVAPVTDIMLVQHPFQIKLFRHAAFKGAIL